RADSRRSVRAGGRAFHSAALRSAGLGAIRAGRGGAVDVLRCGLCELSQLVLHGCGGVPVSTALSGAIPASAALGQTGGSCAAGSLRRAPGDLQTAARRTGLLGRALVLRLPPRVVAAAERGFRRGGRCRGADFRGVPALRRSPAIPGHRWLYDGLLSGVAARQEPRSDAGGSRPGLFLLPV